MTDLLILAAEDQPDEYDRLDQALQVIQAQLDWAVQQKEYPMPSPTDAKPAQKLDYAAIKDRIDIVDYIGRYTTVIRSGARYKAKCPLPGHNDKTASLTIYPESKSWWCFGCHQGRDIFDFAAKMEGLKPQEIDT